jgi:hypothetical protein
MSFNIDQFVCAAESLQAWVKAEPATKEKEAVIALGVLAEIYANAIKLMAIEAGREEPESDESYAVCVDEWKEVYERLDCLPFTYYSELESPHESDKEGTYTDIIEDLADTYQDVIEGLNIYKSGQKEQAVCHWQMTFEFHWGRHVLAAMKALHCFFQDEGDFSRFNLSS